MQVYIKGGNKLQRELVHKVADFMHDKYLSRYKTIEANVSIRNLFDEEHAIGLCFPLRTSRPREFEVEVDRNLPLALFIKTVIHEFIHLKQYVTGELVDTTRGCASVYWNGQDHSRTPYSKQPWERQAYRLQESLYKEFMGDLE